jgi:DNA-binding response OmpR family regulator
MTKRVLIIEDNLDSRELMADMLEFAGFEVLQAIDGEKGEAAAIEHKPDIILLDISLPIKSGWDVAASLQSNADTSHIPIIALTAHARAEDQQRALDEGCRSYLPKPVKPKAVIEEINRLLNL